MQIFENELITAEIVGQISQLKELHTLNLSSNEQVYLEVLASTALELPKLANLNISGVWQREQQDAVSHSQEEDVKKLLQCSNLTSLNMEHCFDLQAGCFLPFIPNRFPPFLRELFLESCNLGTEDLEAIVTGCPNLVQLNLKANSAILSSGFIHLSRLQQLEVLNLTCNAKLGDPGLIALADLPVLRTFHFGPTKGVTTVGFSHFIQHRYATLTDLVNRHFPNYNLNESLSKIYLL